MQINKIPIERNTNIKNVVENELNVNHKSEEVNKTNNRDSFLKYSNEEPDYINPNYNLYKRMSLKTNILEKIDFSPNSIDKGTASNTTVFVNREAYDQILSTTTFGEKKWEEMGVDDEKRWVVINGQRFECEHSAEEKALRKRLKKTLVDYLIEEDKKKLDKKDNGTNKPKGNIEALTQNKEVMNLLGKIFNVGTNDEILRKLA